MQTLKKATRAGSKNWSPVLGGIKQVSPIQNYQLFKKQTGKSPMVVHKDKLPVQIPQGTMKKEVNSFFSRLVYIYYQKLIQAKQGLSLISQYE